MNNLDHVRPGRRRQRLILVTKAITQIVFKKRIKKAAARTNDLVMKSPMLSQRSLDLRASNIVK